MHANERALTADEWWKLMRVVEGVSGDGPLTGLPLAAIHPTRTELVRVRDAATMWLMGHCGFRVGEVVKLQWKEVWCDDQPVSRIAVDEVVGKGGFRRTLPVDAFVSASLVRLRGVANVVLEGIPLGSVLGCGPVWRRIGVRVVQRKVAEFGRVALGRSVGCHQLRHTFAVRVRRASDVAVLQQLLGHRRLASTAIYAGVTGDECAAAVASLSA